MKKEKNNSDDKRRLREEHISRKSSISREQRPAREYPAARERQAQVKAKVQTHLSEDNSDYDRLFDSLRLEGRNAVLEALNHGRPIDKILLKKGEVEGTLKVIAAKAKERGIKVQEVNRLKLDAISQTGAHQGVIALCAAHEYAEVSDILQRAKDRGEEPLVIILDGITDPHNLGAIIRTAEAAGAHGVIIPKNRASGLTGIVSKAAAGALEHVHVAKVINISRVIGELKDAGLWIAAADQRGEDMRNSPLDGPLAIVIGGEGGGSGRLVKEKCDFTVRIPMRGKLSSLNASVAAGVLMYEIVRRRQNL